MNALYFRTHFRTEEPTDDWPGEFAIITACATTGECWPAERTAEAEARLQDELKRRGAWHRRITGFDPEGSHAEAGWATGLSFQEACRLGEQFLQHAIYFVSHDLLSVSECKDGRRQLVPVGRFSLKVEPSQGSSRFKAGASLPDQGQESSHRSQHRLSGTA